MAACIAKQFAPPKDLEIARWLRLGYLWEMLRLLKDEGESFSLTPIKNYTPDADGSAVFEITWG